MVCSRIDTGSGEITWSRAGHTLSIFLDQDGQPLHLEKNHGQPVNLIDNPIFDNGKRQMPVGAGVFFYTDGLTEAPNISGEEFGVERLQQIITDNWEKSVQEICNIVIDQVRAWEGKTTLSDDLTIFGLRRG
jgi:phosphoserine phosphatase RsbU/P